MIAALGRLTIANLEAVGGVFLLFGETLNAVGAQVVRFRFRYRETIDQCFYLAVQSVPVIAFSLTFISLMLVTEFSYHMNLVLKQDDLVPAFSTVLMVRELGPTVTCLLLMSRVGAGIAAEVGTMKVTEQLDTLRLLHVGLVEYLVVPRWLACLFGACSLSLLAVGVAILGGAFLASLRLGNLPEEFLNTMFVFTSAHDFMALFIKSAVFGTLIPIVACYHGFRCQVGSSGVGEAATNAVVHGSVLIIISDFIVTYFLYAL